MVQAAKKTTGTKSSSKAKTTATKPRSRKPSEPKTVTADKLTVVVVQDGIEKKALEIDLGGHAELKLEVSDPKETTHTFAKLTASI